MRKQAVGEGHNNNPQEEVAQKFLKSLRYRNHGSLFTGRLCVRLHAGVHVPSVPLSSAQGKPSPRLIQEGLLHPLPPQFIAFLSAPNPLSLFLSCPECTTHTPHPLHPQPAAPLQAAQPLPCGQTPGTSVPIIPVTAPLESRSRKMTRISTPCPFCT